MTDKRPAKLLICSCQRTMDIDSERLAAALGQERGLAVHTELCRAGLSSFENAVKDASVLHVACTQEAPLFREVAAELASDTELTLRFTNIREDAGWCARKQDATPKMAALLAGATSSVTPAHAMTLTSAGVCLVYGSGETALSTARKLNGRLNVTLLLTDVGEALPPAVVEAPMAKGRIKRARGHLGAFEIEIDGYAPVVPSSRSSLQFETPRDGVKSKCDLILDLTGNAPLFTTHERRDGYVAVKPDDATAIAEAMFALTDMVGEFEKPVYVAYDAGICAHARSAKVGCRNCLDHCPVGAITPDGDHVAIDAAICGGCGNCASVCPTGAASYAYPRREDILVRVQVMLDAYARAGGKLPVLLVHDESKGREAIDAIARFGAGLPVNVIPMGLNSVLQLGHDSLLGLLALGAQQVAVLAPPDRPAETAALEAQAGLARHFLERLGYAGPRVHIIAERDPFVIAAALDELSRLVAITAHRFMLTGTKRETARMVLSKLNAAAPTRQEVIDLPVGAPYGRIAINADGCTLCLSCVGACPTGALGDSEQRPEVTLVESACVQCGICRATCPEKVIKLEPRYDFTNRALDRVVLHGEEPFACISCGKPFGSRSMVERVTERLRSHSMFANERQLAIIQMCDTCRITALASMSDDPFNGGERPRVVTTDDYLAERAAAATDKPRKPDDFLN